MLQSWALRLGQVREDVHIEISRKVKSSTLAKAKNY